MVSIFVGSGAGFARGSSAALGGAGILGSAVQGRSGEAVSVNAATGNLIISQQDEFLIGRGPDIGISRTYNSLAQAGDGDNGDQWQMSSTRRVFGLTGTLGAAGSSVMRQGGDGAVIQYNWDAAAAAYVTTDGDGAHDRLVKSGGNWVWTDGSSQWTETYEASAGDPDLYRIVEQKDTDGNKLNFSYIAGSDKLYRVTSANHGTANADTGIAEQSFVEYSWSGDNITQILTGFTDYGASSSLADNVNRTLTRTRYAYDGQNRLVQVTVDLSPGDNSIADGKTYVTSYSYDGSSKRVASITQTDGSSLAITYDGSGRVATLTQSVAAGDNRVTTLAYGASYTSITGPDGQVTRLDYAGGSFVPSSILEWNGDSVYTLREQAGTLDGEVAGLFTSAPGATWSGISAGGVPVAAGDTLTFSVSLQAVAGSATTQELGLYASTSGWGSGNSTARIISGPGTLIQRVGGRWQVSGLSANEPTRIEITRTYTQAEYGSAYFYVDLPGGYRDGQQLLAAGGSLTKNSAPGADFRQLTKITAPPAYAGASAQTVQFGYDGDGNLASVTDAAGKVTSYSYDANGNMLTSSDANGNGVTRTYGAKNEMLSETLTGSDASGAAVSHTTRYVYDSETHLRYMISAQGRVTEYRYSGPGQLELTITYPEHDYPIGSGAVTEAAMNSWRDAISDRQSAQYLSHIYDARGNLIQQVDYGYATPAGGASTTEGYTHNYFTYDQSGRLLSRQTATQNIETFVYDGLGRLVASTDKAGASTTILFNDAALTTSVTTGSGFTTVSSYNKAGDLVATSRSGTYDPSGSTSYLYDKLGRVRVATDATGNKSYVIYDKAGRKVADVNHYGHVTEYFYTAAGRVGGSVSYTNALTAAQITALGNPDNMLEMAALRPAAHTYDIWGWSVYDDGGRLIESIAGDGSVARFAYDGSDRLVKTTHFYNKLSAAQLTALRAAVPSAVVVPASDARDTVSRSFYDRDGRLIGALDGEGYLSEIVYDKAGQKVEEVAYAAKTGSTYWDAGSFDQLRASAAPTSSSNRRARYVYDGQGLLRFAIDTAGYVTEYVYESDVKWGAVGLVRSTIVHATAIATSDFTYDNVKALVAANAGNAANRKSFAVYDAAGRLAYAIDAEGAVTGFAYDAMGHVIKTVAYAAKRATSTLPTEAVMNSWRDANIGNAANRITRAWYTAAGNLRFTVDAEGYVTRNDYDAEGRLTAIKRWPNKIATTDVTSIATVDVLTLSAGTAIIETRTYDAAGHLSTTTDGEGVITAYYYYANGSQYLTVFAYGTADEARVVRGFDGAGRVVSEYAAYGQPEQAVTAYSYDGLGNLTSVTDPRGKVTTFSYDERGLRLSATDAAGGVTTYEYNGFGEAVKTTDPRGAVTYRYYDGLGRVVMTRDAENYITETSYTRFGEIASVTRRYNKTVSAASTTTPPAVTAHAKDATTLFEYDKRGLVTKTTDAEGWFESYAYDAFANRTSVTAKSKDAGKVAGGTTTYAYDKRGLLVTETRPAASVDKDGNVTGTVIVDRHDYDAHGNRIRTIEADGLPEARTTDFVYDKVNRLIRTERDVIRVNPSTGSNELDRRVDTNAYDLRGNVTSRTDAGGARTVYYYDDLNRVVVTIDAVGVYSRHSYDEAGNILSTRVYSAPTSIPADGGGLEEIPGPPAGPWRETQFSYDNLSRLLTSTVEDMDSGYWNGTSYILQTDQNLTTVFEYDATGNVVRSFDPNGNVTYSYYDRLGRKTALLDAGGYMTSWSYDGEGNVVEERRFATRFLGTATTVSMPVLPADAADRISRYSYDRNSNRLSEVRVGVVVHNGSGNTASVDATLAFEYNGLGQVIRRVEATGDDVLYSYDEVGRLVREKRTAFAAYDGTTATPTVEYFYNGLDQLSRSSAVGAVGTGARVTRYQYGVGGVLEWVQDANGQTVYHYQDIAGRSPGTLTFIQRSDGTLLNYRTTTIQDALGRTLQTRRYYYDHAAGAGWDWGETQEVTYNAFGEISTTSTNGIVTSENRYDAAGRLIATNAGDGVWKLFGYDRNGNQTIAITTAGESLAGLTFAQAFAKIGQANVNATYMVYDARNMATSTIEEGRQLVGTSDSQTLISSRSYNAFGETASETNAAGATTSYSYNGIGRMIRSEGPTVQITLENGTSQWVKPSQDYYYDASGRLVATRDANGDYAAGGTATNGTSKAANSGNLTRLTLLAGTGYNGSEALVTAETHADGGIKQTKYDIHGDARTLIDEIGRTTTQSFDAMGRVTQVGHAGGLIDYYGYDGLGQRIKHWNSFLGTGDVETTDYDTQGRVSKTRAFGGDITTIATTWDATIAASGMGITTGGWTTTTSTVADRASSTDQVTAIVEKRDVYGRMVDKIDAGGQNFDYIFDASGRLITENSQYVTGYAQRRRSYSYFNTGQIAAISMGDPASTTSDWVRQITSYTYDAMGNQTGEKLQRQWGDYTAPRRIWLAPGEPEWVPASYETGSELISDGRAQYDALGRMIEYRDVPTTGLDNVFLTRAYDANGNIRKIASTYRPMQVSGTVSTSTTAVTYWYRYDSMNRTVVSKGFMSGSTIVRGTTGTDLSYALDGSRATAQTGSAAQESYAYNNGGLLTSVVIGGVQRASTNYDLVGRIITSNEYDASGIAVYSRYAITYDARGQVLAEKSSTKQGSDWIYAHTANYYSANGGGGTPANISSASTVGTSSGTVLYFSETKYWKNGGTPFYGTPGNYSSADLAYADSYNSYAYGWSDGAYRVSETLTNRDGTSQSYYAYNRDVQLIQVQINGGARPRSISYLNNAGGQVISRKEVDNNNSVNDPSTRSYFFAGRQMGEVSNNGTDNVSYTTWITNHTNVDGSGPFREGSTTASIFADFDQSYTAINGGVATGAGSYAVRAGDTLQGIAQAVWGDAGLWYHLAAANGLSGSGQLIQGMTLTIPGSIMPPHNNADTMRAYDPAKAIGDVSPNTPQPPRNSKSCGFLGKILIAAVAIGLSVWLGPQFIQAAQGLLAGAGGAAAGSAAAIGGGIIGGAAAGAVSSIASQGFGIAIGAQSGFSWKGVGLAALGGGIGGALGGFNAFGGAAPGSFGGIANAAIRGIAGSVLTQGIGVATGLQPKFDFAGVAAAGIGAGAADFAGARTASWEPFGSDLATGMASALANAATRSAVSGNSFGDNLIAALPDAIGGALGRAGARGLAALGNGGGAAGLGAAGAALGSGAAAAGHLALRSANPTYLAGTFDADGFNTSLIRDSLVALGADMPAGNRYRMETGPVPIVGDEIVVVSNPHIGYLLNPLRMSSERFAGYLSATGGVNSHYWAHKFQNQLSASSASRTPARSSADDHWGGAKLSPYETGKRLISSFVNGIVQTASSSGKAALTVYLAQSNVPGMNAMARARIREMGKAIVNGEALQGAVGHAAHVFDRAVVYDDLGPAAEAAGSAAFGGVLGKLSLSAATARVGVAAESTVVDLGLNSSRYSLAAPRVAGFEGTQGTLRRFTSNDPLVANLANDIEALYPGHVVGVNVPIRNATGGLVTDADILLRNSILQVKSGGGKGLTSQILRTEGATGIPTIGYGPTLKPSVVRSINQTGGLVTTDRGLLLEVVKP